MDYNLNYLVEKLKEVHIASHMKTLDYWQKKGRIIFRRKPSSNHRIVNDKEIAEIIKAFLPEGIGRWYHER